MAAPLLLALALALPARAVEVSSVPVRGVEIYRSRALDVAALPADIRSRLSAFSAQRSLREKRLERSLARLKQDIEQRLRAHGMAYAELYVGEYATSAARTLYLTLDVVDKADAATRLAFQPEPKGSVPDPDGLLAAWQEFQSLGDSLARDGTVDPTNRPSCPGFYCTWPASRPELGALEKKIAGSVVADRAQLEKTLAKDADPAKRASAMYALSYLPGGADVARLCAQALRDPAADVRAAALVILSDVAVYHKTVLIDPAPVIAALDDPASQNRAKALGVVVTLADNQAYQQAMMQRALPALLALLRTRQPSTHDLAYTTLVALSRESFDQHDYAAWAKWAASKSGGAAEAPGVSVADDVR